MTGSKKLKHYGLTAALAGACVQMAGAAMLDNPYQEIVDRNLFQLKPPPPVTAPEPTKPPTPKFVINGITTILGNKRALISAPLPGKPGEPARQVSLVMAVDQKDGDVWVKDIDDKAGTVTIEYQGAVIPLSIEKDSAKLVAAAPPQPTSSPFAGGGTFLPPGSVPSGAANAAGGSGVTPIPQRTLRVPQGGNASTSVGSPGISGGATPSVAAGGVTLPSFGTPSAPQPQGAVQGSELSLEERETLLEVNHQVAKAKGDPSAPYYPPSFGNPNRNAEAGASNPNATAGTPATPNPGAPLWTTRKP